MDVNPSNTRRPPKKWLVTVSGRSYYLLGAPIGRQDQQAFEQALQARFGNESNAFEYMERVLDRQISKASGLLSYNSILVAALSFGGFPHWLGKISAAIALFSCLPLLLMLYVSWHEAEVYQQAKSDFQSSCVTCYWRSYLLTISLLLSTIATILIFLAILFFFQ